MFTATKLQAATYLIGVCLFSISFLVFLNSSVSFVVTDILHQHTGIGDAVGTLGFADELVALVACPLWGLLSDRIGFSTVCLSTCPKLLNLHAPGQVSSVGYAIVGISLFLFVQAGNVYPELLLARMVFAVGGAATATMVTAILPSMTAERPGEAVTDGSSGQDRVSPVQSAHLMLPGSNPTKPSDYSANRNSPVRLAGFVGAFAGAGALIALVCFLPLPAQFSKLDVSKERALEYTFYIVGAVALVVSVVCFVGLRSLPGEHAKSVKRLWHIARKESARQGASEPIIAYRKMFVESLRIGVNDPLIGLGYLGGFVARASSVGITLFIPLLVNNYFTSSGLCESNDPVEIKSQCKEAYILASKLTGTSQLVALLCAPIFGFVDHRFPRYHVTLMVAAICGIAGYTGLASIETPDPSKPGGTNIVYLVVALLGISQIGAIVCSLGLLGRAIASSEHMPHVGSQEGSGTEDPPPPSYDNNAQDGEASGLLASAVLETSDRHRLQGSVAGVYSFCGGAGILLLTKLGGYLFDSKSPGSPFIMMAVFNAILLVGTVMTTAGQQLPSLFGR